MKKKGPRVNQRITSDTVRLIGADGVMVGIVDLETALQQAKEANLDLVEVNPTSDPPVCKILEYGRMKYDLKKKFHQSKKKQNVITTKEVKIRPNIGDHDYSVKLKSIRSFLKDNCKVKVSLRFRGREVIYQQNGMEVLEKIIEETKDLGQIDGKISKSDNQLLMLLVSKSDGKRH